jgi:hypothetical protein
MEWKSEFLRLLCSTNSNKEDIQKAFLIKFQERPPSIFKFRKFDDYSMDILRSDKVWLARPASLNDPYECLNFADFTKIPQPLFDDTKGDFSPLFVDEVNRIAKENGDNDGNYSAALIDALFSEYRNKPEFANEIGRLKSYASSTLASLGSTQASHFREFFCLCSFSENLKSMLMWSHYADMHRGFCIEYALEKSESTNPLVVALHPVVYSDKRFDSTDHFINFANKTPSNGLVVFGAGLIKSRDWEYEREWRLLKLEKGANSGQFFDMPTPSMVYLGSHISTKNEAEILSLCHSKSIPVKRMAHKSERFEMEAR